MNLTCTTSLCDPQANITWYKESKNITNNSTYSTFNEGALVKTTSVLQILASKEDNRQRIYCAATNIPGRSKTSSMHTLEVLCKFWFLFIENVIYIENNMDNYCSWIKFKSLQFVTLCAPDWAFRYFVIILSVCLSLYNLKLVCVIVCKIEF